MHGGVKNNYECSSHELVSASHQKTADDVISIG